MEKSKQVIIENSTTIKTLINTITSLLLEIEALDKKHVATLVDNEDEDIVETIKQHSSINRSQCAMLCVLNKTVINIEALLLSERSYDTYDDSFQRDSDLKTSKTNVISIAEEEVAQTENDNKSECKSERNSIEEEVDKSSVQNIVEVLKNYKGECNEKNEDQNAQFKLSGRRTSSKNGKMKTKVTAFYEIFERPLPQEHSVCMISHMESPSEFYIHVVDEQVVYIDEISSIISAAYSKTPCSYQSKTEMCEELGRYCVAYVDKYDQWYRVELLNWLLESDTNLVKVQLFDYGVCVYVPFYKLHPMLEEVSHYPKLAQRCHLHTICPVGQEDRVREAYTWPVTSIEAFMEILESYTECQYEIVFVTSSCNSIGIDLKKDTDESSISEQLYKLGVVAITLIDEKENVKNDFMIQQVLETQGFLDLPSMTENEKLNRFFDTALPLERTEDINEAIANYNPTDEKRICKFQDKCRKKNCKFEHVTLTKDFTTDRLPIYTRAFYDLDLPKGGEMITLLITHIKTVCNFYIHVNPSFNNIAYTQFVQMDEMINYPGTIKTYKPMKILPAVGEIVLVKNWDDRWRRAQVQETRALDDIDSVFLQVFIVDYGEVVDVKLSDVRQIEKDFLQVPFQAVECRLFNAIENVNVDAEEAKEYLMFYLNGYNPAQVISSNAGYLELLVSVENNEDLGEKLIQAGYAVLKTTSSVPGENELFLVD